MRSYASAVLGFIFFVLASPLTFAQTPQLNAICVSAAVPCPSSQLTEGGHAWLQGSGFGSQQSTSEIFLQNVNNAPVVNWSSTLIEITVPYGTYAGHGYIVVSGNSSNTSGYTFTQPTLNAICASATVPCPSTQLTEGGYAWFQGSGFGMTQYTGSGVCLQNTCNPTISSWSDTLIKVSVPYGTIAGNGYVTNSDTSSNTSGYTFPPPQLSDICTTATGQCNSILIPGQTAYLRGSGFGTQQYTGSGVYLQNQNNLPVAPGNWTDSLITIKVPVGTISGHAYVQNSDNPSGTVQYTMQPPAVYALNAPYCLGGDETCNSTYISNFITYELPSVSGIALIIHWADFDTGCTDGSVSRCTTVPTQCPELHQNTDYKFCKFDNGLYENYINSGAFTGKKIVLIVWPTNEPPSNTNVTPPYVFTQAWANEIPGVLQPQDEVVCSGGYLGDTGNAGACPVQQTGTPSANDFAIWNAAHCTTSVGGSPVTTKFVCAQQSCGSNLDTTGFPIVYETPFMTAYQNFLSAFAQHYNPKAPNPNGTNLGPTIAPYIAYVRPGLTGGGENLVFCAIKGSGGMQESPWKPNTSIPAGYIVNTGTNQVGGTQYVSTGAGTTGGTSMPTCSTPGCTTAADGTVPGWYNTNTWPASGTTQGKPVWPSTKGQFSGGAGGYTDNGYLTTSTGNNDNSGYFAAMMTFLKGLNASFPWDISAHDGPPATTNTAYADSEAVTASLNGVGFGMESVSIEDQQTYNAGQYPTTLSDWAYNFANYSAPVHHLQTFFPGSPFFAAGYPITNIVVTAGGGTQQLPNVATINCNINPPNNTGCSWYDGGPVYITGNSEFNPQNGNEIQVTNPCQGCSVVNYLVFDTAVDAGTYTGGTVWAPDYWPIIMPFATLQGATAMEVYECDIDYTFGAYPNSETTYWAKDDTGEHGCASWGLLGPDQNYKGALGNMLNY